MATERWLVTGATGLLGSDVLARLLRGRPSARAVVLVRDPARWTGTAIRKGIPAERVDVLRGDLRLPGLGLDAAARARLARDVGHTLHLAADIVFSRPLDEARATNVEGTRNLLSALDGGRGRFCYVSTAFVAGRRTGLVTEDDPGGEAGWVNAYEQSKWEAEQLVRGSGRDFLILRSSTVVCDSPRGEVSQFNAVHRALRLFRRGLAPMVPGREHSPVDLIPADYAGRAIAALAPREELSGATLHLCAGRGAIGLGELLDLTFQRWKRRPEWRRRGISRPALADLATYRLFERSVEETGDARLQQVMRSLSHFAPQLALEKRFDTRRADAALGEPAPQVRDYWPNVLDHLFDKVPGPEYQVPSAR